jgi:hypothetical protein
MKSANVPIDRLYVDPELSRSSPSKKFLHLLEASIREVGLVEPLKAAEMPSGRYVIVDGVLRYEAIQRIRVDDTDAWRELPVLLFPYSRRYEVRFQTDIYQDLLPSQLAGMVELLHSREDVAKREIAASLGVAPATLRNYTGLWRLSCRGEASKAVVELMDAGVLPASNPFAWLRLTETGVERALVQFFSARTPLSDWAEEVSRTPPAGRPNYPLALVEEVTGSLPAQFYRQDADVRSRKKSYGQRHAVAIDGQITFPSSPPETRTKEALRHVQEVADRSPNLVLRTAATALASALK